MRISDWSSDVCSSDLADAAGKSFNIATHVDPDRGATMVTVYAADHPGLFYRLAGAIGVAGGNIIDARIHTTRDGMALDNLLVQDPLGGPLDDPERLRRLVSAIEEAFTNRHRMRSEEHTSELQSLMRN